MHYKIVFLRMMFSFLSSKPILCSEKLNQFELSFSEQNLNDMEMNFQANHRNYFYLDSALEEGKEKIVDFFLAKVVRPSLFANQM